MRFRVRDGFRLFSSPGDAAAFECSGARSGVRPIEAGAVVTLNMEQVVTLRGHGKLGGLDPVDEAARLAFGDTKPLVSDVYLHPERYAERAEPTTPAYRIDGAS